MAAKPVDTDARLERFIQLRKWFGGIGCCWNCQYTLALAQVERENGGSAPNPVDLSDCRHFDDGARCRRRANDNRKAMPERP